MADEQVVVPEEKKPNIFKRFVTGSAFVAGVLVGGAGMAAIPENASDEAITIASELTGIDKAAIMSAKKEERIATLEQLPEAFVKLPYDSATKKQDSVKRATETKWETVVNDGFWINWPKNTTRMPLTTTDSYETDTGAVIIKMEFRPSDSLIDACGGIAVQRKITYTCIPLYGTVTR